MTRVPGISAAILSCALGLGSANAELFSDGRWVDLTHAFSEETVYWPTAERFKLGTVFEGMTEAGYYYSAYNCSAAEHGGTHIDYGDMISIVKKVAHCAFTHSLASVPSCAAEWGGRGFVPSGASWPHP